MVLNVLLICMLNLNILCLFCFFKPRGLMRRPTQIQNRTRESARPKEQKEDKKHVRLRWPVGVALMVPFDRTNDVAWSGCCPTVVV